MTNSGKKANDDLMPSAKSYKNKRFVRKSPPFNNKRCAMTDYGYCRISAYDRLQTGLSIQAQKERLLANGIAEPNIFIDGGRSGGVKEDELEYRFKDGRFFVISIDLQPRKEFRRLIELLKPGDTVHYVKHDRLSRHNAFSDFFHLYCEHNDIKLNCLDESNETIIRQLMGILAQNELAKTTSRNASIQESVFKKGGWPFKPPFGYTKNSKVREGPQRGMLRYANLPESCLILDPATASTVQEVFRRMALGEPIETIAATTGINTAAVYTIIKNKAYLGQTHFSDDDWKPTPLIPALVTREQFDAANARVTGKRYGPGERKAAL